MSEKTIQEALQTVLVASATYSSGDVTINDWGVLDGPTANAPYVVIQTADDFNVSFSVASDESTWSEILNLVVRFVDWDTTLTAFRDNRQSTISALSSPANGTVGLAVRNVRSGGPIVPIYETYADADIQADALPAFLTQPIVADCQEF